MKIGIREVGHKAPPYIIAELGVNHDGSPETAIELTRRAAAAGADAVKFQFFRAEMLMSRASRLAAYQRAAGESDPVEMLRRLELPLDALAACVKQAHALGVHAIVSVFSVELVAEAASLPWDAFKAASPDIVNRPLLEAMGAAGRPLIVSTGASTLDEVRRAAAWLEPIRDRLAFLQCVSCYPAPAEMHELGGIAALRAALDVPVGYSDHLTGVSSGAEAVRCGACILEKHFTHDRGARGPDHAASLDAEEMHEYIELARAARGARAPTPCAHAPLKRVLAAEQDVRTVSRQSLTATRDLPAGHPISRQDLTIKRPGTGLPPFELGAVVGRRLSRGVEADMPLTWEDLA